MLLRHTTGKLLFLVKKKKKQKLSRRQAQKRIMLTSDLKVGHLYMLDLDAAGPSAIPGSTWPPSSYKKYNKTFCVFLHKQEPDLLDVANMFVFLWCDKIIRLGRDTVEYNLKEVQQQQQKQRLLLSCEQEACQEFSVVIPVCFK